MSFQPDYCHLLDAAHNRRPARLPIYEHIIAPEVMEKVLGAKFAALGTSNNPKDLDEFFRHFCRFFAEMTYDTVSYEVCITHVVPDSGALHGGKPGPIQNRNDFEKFPWADMPRRYWELATPRFDALARQMPEGMRGIGGVGNGIFEVSEDLVGFEYLCLMLSDDPELVGQLYARIGELMLTIWDEFLRRYGKLFAVCRFGDDMGFKTSTLLAPQTLLQHVVPQHKRIYERVHQAGGTFLFHSCGKIFDLMEAEIAAGIDCKHSNEDAIATFGKWIELYGDRIGLFGGIDVDLLVREKPDEIRRVVVELGSRFRRETKGFALGSGNSIPDYVPVDGYLAMIEGAKELRRQETA